MCDAKWLHPYLLLLLGFCQFTLVKGGGGEQESTACVDVVIWYKIMIKNHSNIPIQSCFHKQQTKWTYTVFQVSAQVNCLKKNLRHQLESVYPCMLHMPIKSTVGTVIAGFSVKLICELKENNKGKGCSFVLALETWIAHILCTVYNTTMAFLPMLNTKALITLSSGCGSFKSLLFGIEKKKKTTNKIKKKNCGSHAQEGGTSI